MLAGGINVGSGDANSALALLTLLADPARHKKALADIAEQVKISEEALEGAQKAHTESKSQLEAASVKLKQISDIEIGVREKEAQIAKRELQLSEDRKSFEKNRAGHSEWHETEAKRFEEGKKAREVHRKETVQLGLDAAKLKKEAEELMAEATALKKEYEGKIAQLSSLVGGTTPK